MSQRERLYGQCVLLLGLLSVWCMLLVGCATYQPRSWAGGAVPARFQGAGLVNHDDVEWPARLTEQLERQAEATPREIYSHVIDGRKAESEIEPRYLALTDRPEARVKYVGRHGVGLIRVIEGGSGPDDPRWWVRWNSAVRFISNSARDDLPMDRRRRWLQRSLARTERNERFAERTGVRANDPAIVSIIGEGIRLQIDQPLLDRRVAGGVNESGVGTLPGEPVGLLIHMSGLGSLEWEQPVIDELRRRGWAVLRISTPRVWWYADTVFTVDGLDGATAVGERVAGMVDEVLAEPAYAAEAALSFIEKERPDLVGRPLAVVGFSAGALFAPAIAARLGEAVDALVLIGGGANLLGISQDSDLTDGGIKLQTAAGKPLSSAVRARVEAAYLRRTELDPYTLAPRLAERRVLTMLAEFDTTVPAGYGLRLQRRLGNPDRYTFIGEHRLLFWSLRWQADRIANWVERATGVADTRTLDVAQR